LCTGDFGIFYRSRDGKSIPKMFDKNQFYEYLEGRKKFPVKILAVRGAHDSISLCRRIYREEIKIPNFKILVSGDLVTIDISKDKNSNTINPSKIKIGGIGGSYSPKLYAKDKLIGNEQRHFNKKSIDRSKSLDILLIYDLIGNCSKKKILFSEETRDMIGRISPIYCFLGKYHWWGYAKVGMTNVVLSQSIENGYLILDTDRDWRVEGIRFDIGGKIDSSNTAQ